MLLKLTIASPDVEDFVAEVLVESHHTFADLNRLIQSVCGWNPNQPATFYVCDHRWRPEHIVPETGSVHDTMSEVEIGDLLEDEGQRLQYLFNPSERRTLLLEVTETSFGKHLDSPRVGRQHGTPPLYSIEEVEETPAIAASETNDDLLSRLNAEAMELNDDEEDFDPEDTSDFDPEEFDPEGYEVGEF